MRCCIFQLPLKQNWCCIFRLPKCCTIQLPLTACMHANDILQNSNKPSTTTIPISETCKQLKLRISVYEDQVN